MLLPALRCADAGAPVKSAAVTCSTLTAMAACAVGVSPAACGTASVPSPFISTDASPDGHESSAEAGDAGVVLDGAALPPEAAAGEWGGPCVDDDSCDDGVSCTADHCDPALGRCHFVPDAALCDDGVYCNGSEECVPVVGCRPGEPVACSDETACTIDSCDEATHQCNHVPRDADLDGDPDGNCPSGGDCNDTDPNISSTAAEVCANGIDDDCDGVIDEADCVSPKYDTCAAPLDVTGSASYLLSTAATHLDYAASCVQTSPRSRDLAVAVHVPDGDPVDVELTLDGTGGTAVGIAAATQCGDASSELACGSEATSPNGAPEARIRMRGLSKGVYPVYVFTDAEAFVTLAVDYVSAVPEPANETCGTSLAIAPDVHVDANLIDAARDLESACGVWFGDLVYDFRLTQPRDVRIFAASKDQAGTPMLSLRSSQCADAASELLCHVDTNDTLFYRALPAGHYFIAVGATGPTDVDVLLKEDPPTVASDDESCATAPTLEPAVTTNVSMEGHMDDLQLGCGVGMPDAAYALDIAAEADLLLVLGVSDGDTAAMALTHPACTPASVLSCTTGSGGPLRATLRDVAPGDYRVVAESKRSNPLSITVFSRPSMAPFLVPFSDACAQAAEIPETGGSFQGNTANSTDDFSASCDVGGGGGSPDQVLHLRLEKERRVVFDTRGSDYATIVDVREGATCPGDELEGGCSAGYGTDRSYLDLTLPAGDYWVQVDGYDTSSGPWLLDVFTSD